ncbi:DNA alkylation repair protein [Bdellovibrio sp. BCCA]|uniref:DNA alkylation repair protein n=1 Tax=Bdellovibrio sp. BCCA TaxID=3136281 RepID=UPI0030F16775
MIREIQKDIRKSADATRAKNLKRFFKTDPGEYGEGDVFIGLTVPQSRAFAKKYFETPLKDLEVLLKSEIHEERLIALIILSNRFAKSDEREKFQIYKLYLKNTKYINNWDLVDTSAEYIVGGYLYDKDRKVLQQLAKSKSLWERRIAMLSTFHFIKKGEYQDTLRIARILLKDEHDLIHKASGWMLREMGKRVSEKELRGFLEKYASKMPRTMLRYAIEKFSPKDRRYYLDLK